MTNKFHGNALVIDPGTKLAPEMNTGLAYIENGVITDTKLISCPSTMWNMQEIIDEFDCRFDVNVNPTLVIEDQFMGFNAKSVFMIHEVAVRWRVLAEFHGWSVFRVAPSTWQTYWGISPRWKWGKKVKNDEFCRQIAEYISGKKLSLDESAAWLMAGYWLALVAKSL